jgi:hypothetical protein
VGQCNTPNVSAPEDNALTPIAHALSTLANQLCIDAALCVAHLRAYFMASSKCALVMAGTWWGKSSIGKQKQHSE